MGDVGIALNIIGIIINQDSKDRVRLEEVKEHFKTEIKTLEKVEDLPKMVEECIKVSQQHR